MGSRAGGVAWQVMGKHLRHARVWRHRIEAGWV
jgi:hypothetical protein